MQTLIVYYSLEGNTAFAAEKIAESLGAETLRLEPVKEYPGSGMKKFLWGGKSALMGEEPPLRPYTFDAGAWDRIIFGPNVDVEVGVVLALPYFDSHIVAPLVGDDLFPIAIGVGVLPFPRSVLAQILSFGVHSSQVDTYHVILTNSVHTSVRVY